MGDDVKELADSLSISLIPHSGSPRVFSESVLRSKGMVCGGKAVRATPRLGSLRKALSKPAGRRGTDQKTEKRIR